MFVISIKTNLLARYIHDLDQSVYFQAQIGCFTRCVIVVRKMYVEVYKNTEIGNTRGIAPVVMHELKVAQSCTNVHTVNK
jgi:hypothetical protein